MVETFPPTVGRRGRTDNDLEMKRCPECQRSYDDETLKYCLDDGALLVYGPGSGDAATAILTPAYVGGEAPTQDLSRQSLLNHDASKTTEHKSTFWNRPSGRAWFFVGLAILALAGGYLAYRQLTTSTNKQVDSIAVMPFVNATGNADLEYLSDGMTETLISSLSQIPKLNVKARTSVFRYKGKDVEAKTVGKELN